MNSSKSGRRFLRMTNFEEGYAVKLTVYQSPNGNLTRHLKQAQLFTDRELAEQASKLANGSVVDVKRQVRDKSIDSEAKASQKSKEVAKHEVKTTRANQNWMK